MVKPINEFGGWLRFFQIVSWLNCGLFAVLGIFSFYIFFVDADGRDIPMGMLVETSFVVFAICTGIIARLLPIQGADIPRRVFTQATIVISVAVVTMFAIAGLEAYRAGDSLLVHIESPGGIWLIAMQFYMQRSKRVAAYYGSNYGFGSKKAAMTA